jgi:hypothetical protein
LNLQALTARARKLWQVEPEMLRPRSKRQGSNHRTRRFGPVETRRFHPVGVVPVSARSFQQDPKVSPRCPRQVGRSPSLALPKDCRAVGLRSAAPCGRWLDPKIHPWSNPKVRPWSNPKVCPASFRSHGFTCPRARSEDRPAFKWSRQPLIGGRLGPKTSVAANKSRRHGRRVRGPKTSLLASLCRRSRPLVEKVRRPLVVRVKSCRPRPVCASLRRAGYGRAGPIASAEMNPAEASPLARGGTCPPGCPQG